MDTKIVLLSTVVVFMSYGDAYGSGRYQRSPLRELQTSLMDINVGGDIESRIWKRAAPRDIKKNTKSNEAIPELDTYSDAQSNNEPDAPLNSDEFSETDTGPPISETKNSRKPAPTSTKTRPNIKGANPGVKSPRNNKSKTNFPTTPKPVSLPDPNPPSNPKETENPDEKKIPETDSDPVKPSKSRVPPRANGKSLKSSATTSKPRNFDSHNNDDNDYGGDKPQANPDDDDDDDDDDEREPEEPEENHEDEEEPEENTEDEKESEENQDDEKEPEENPEDEKESEGNTNDEEEPEENTEGEENPEEPIEHENEPEDPSKEDGKKIDNEKPARPRSPASPKPPQKPTPTPRPSRLPSNRPTRPPPPFPGDPSNAKNNKPRAESPITYIRPFKATTTTTTTTPQPSKEPESNDDDLDAEDNNNDENPILTSTPAPERKTKNPPKSLIRPRINNTPAKTSNKKNKPVETPAPDDTDESAHDDSSDDNPNDDEDAENDPEESIDENTEENSDPIPTTTTSKPRTESRKRPKNSIKHRPTKRPKSPPFNPTNDEEPDMIGADEQLDLPSRFADTEPDTQLPENPVDHNTKVPSKSQQPPQNQNPNSNSSPENTFMNNPFFSSPFGFGVAKSFTSADSNASPGSSVFASASANSNAELPNWGPWPNFFPNAFGNPSFPSPRMFPNNPFLNNLNPTTEPSPNTPTATDSPIKNKDSSKKRSNRGNTQSSSPSKPEPSGYTPIISISGSFDASDPPILSRSSFSSSDPTSESKGGNKIDLNAPSHGPIGNINLYPFSGRMPEYSSGQNYGYPTGAGGFASASSYSNAGNPGFGIPSSSMYGGRSFPGYNDVSGFPTSSEVQPWGTFAGQNWPSYNDITAQNKKISDQIQSQIQNMQQQNQQLSQQMLAMMSNPENGPVYTQRTYSSFPGLYPNYQHQGFQQSPLANQNFPNSDILLSSRFNGEPGSDNSASAFGQAFAGPGGTSQMGVISPGDPNSPSHFALNGPGSGGNSFATRVVSHSSTDIGPNGEPIVHKVVTTEVNDNGKITSKTIRSR